MGLITLNTTPVGSPGGGRVLEGRGGGPDDYRMIGFEIGFLGGWPGRAKGEHRRGTEVSRWQELDTLTAEPCGQAERR